MGANTGRQLNRRQMSSFGVWSRMEPAPRGRRVKADEGALLLEEYKQGGISPANTEQDAAWVTAQCTSKLSYRGDGPPVYTYDHVPRAKVCLGSRAARIGGPGP